jgi:hypothetical protein
MTEEEWETSIAISDLLDAVESMASRRKLRLFTVGCCQLMWDYINPEHGHPLVLAAEQFADGKLTEEERERLDRQWPNMGDFRWFPTTWGGGYSADAAARACIVERALIGAHSGSYDARLARGRWAYFDQVAIEQAVVLRDIFGNPFQPAAFDPAWRTETVTLLAKGMYESRDFSAMPILADALQEADCDNDDILNHCRDPKGIHVRGCWVVDLVLGKE